MAVGPERTQEEVQELVKADRCLNCEKPLAESTGPVRRGLDTGCYNAVKRAVDNHTLSDSQAIAAGLWLVKDKGGRPKAKARTGSALDRYLKRMREVEVTKTTAEGVAANHKPISQ